jgi:2-hydroxy-6-oxo-6-(2'-aminophenyl)hexa-2,4-dienoate hydrolase
MASEIIPGSQSKFIDAAGIKTHYFEAGSGDPVMLLHGGGAGADAYGNWRGLVPVLAKRFKVFAVDMVGFGETAKPAPSDYEYSQQNRNTHIAALVEALDVGKMHLVGNSMGGCTSMGVAINRPELVNRLILMGSAGVKHPLSDELKSIMNYDFTTEGMRKIVKGLTNPNFEVDEKMVTYRHELSLQDDTRAAYGAVMGWIGGNGGLYYEEDYMRQVSHKTLVVNGKLDKVVPIECAYRLLELIENSWGFFIPNCGHWAMIEHAEDFARTTENFLSS